MIANRALSSVRDMLSRHLSEGRVVNGKHDVYRDFGWIESPELSHFQKIYYRMSLAKAGIDKKVEKVWETNPLLQAGHEEHRKTEQERRIERHFSRIRIWRNMMEADRNALVGEYAGLVLRVRDGRPLHEPMGRISALEDLVEVVPAWSSQLSVADQVLDSTSSDFGEVLMYNFTEDTRSQTPRTVRVHPSRVVVWSTNGKIWGNESAIEPVLNDLMTIQLIVGSGGEGFWKNAKSAPVIEIDKDGRLKQLADMLQVPVSELPSKFNEIIENWQHGFDELLMLQGMEAKTLGVSLPQPEQFHRIALMGVAAGFGIPMKIFVGTQTGERASTEDADEWAYTSMGRRSREVVPNIMNVVDRLVQHGALADEEWRLNWADLTESGAGDKMNRATRMTEANEREAKSAGERIFTGEEIRRVAGFEPLEERLEVLPQDTGSVGSVSE